MSWLFVRPGESDPPPRCGHTATAVVAEDSGKLVVFGGFDGTQYYNDLYVLARGSRWERPTTSGERPSPRTGHSCVTVGSQVYIFGGFDGQQALNDLHVLNTETWTWSKLTNSSGDPPKGRYSHSATLMKERYMYVLGGKSGTGQFWSFSDVYVLDVQTLTWEHKVFPNNADCPPPRAWHTATVIGDKIYIFGGGTDKESYNELHCLGPEKWCRVSTSGRTPSPRCGHTAVYVPEESMLIIFGGAAQSRADFRPSDNDVHVLSIDLKGKVMKWKTKKVTFGMKGTKPNVYAYHAAVSLSQSKIAVFGGFCCDENNKQREGTRICNDLLILYHLDQLLVPVKTSKRGKSTRQKDGSMFQIRRKNTTEDKKAKIKPVKKKKREGKKKTKDGGDDGIGLPYQVQHTIHVDQDFNWTGGESVFQIEEKLGEGAYGAVYKGRQKETGFILAIKEINDGGDFDDLKKEIEILKRCRNKHVVCYYGTTNAKNNNNNLWILMEYCSVGSVRDLIEMSELTLVEDQVAFICREALMGLVYLHAQKIIHRDVKAANILVDSAGTVKIADFGVSEQLSGEKSQERIGTPLWMAPEVMQNREYDSRCDIWSLGITAIEMADGLPPRHELSPARAMRLIPSQPPPTLENPAEWSDEFNAFVKRCLVKDPTNRPTAMDLLTDPFIVNAKGPEVLRERIVQVMKIRKAQRMKKLKEAKGEGEDEDDETNSSNTTTTSTTTTSNHTSTQDSAFSTMVVVDGEQGECKLNEDFSIFSTVIVNAQELEEEGEAEGGDMWSTVRVRQVDEDEEDGSGSGDAFSTMVVRDDDEEEEDEDGGDAFSTMVVRKADDGGEDDEEDDDVGGDAFSTIVVRKKVVEEEADEDEEGGDAFSTMVVTRSNKTEEGGDDSAFDDAVRRKFLGQQQQIERRTEEEEETDFAEAVRRKFGMMGTSDNNEEDDQPPPLPPRTKGGRRRAEKMTAETIELLRPLVERYVAETVDAVLERKLQQELDALQKKASG